MNNAQRLFITVDTNLFFKSGFNFQSAPIASLMQFKISGEFILSEIVMKEARNNFLRKAAEHKAETLRKLQHPLLQPWQPIAKLNESIQALTEANDTGLAVDTFDSFIRECGATIVPIQDVSLSEVVDRYFSRKSPFSSRKKSEFPDAIALLALRDFAQQSSGKIIVVSEDEDWREFCKEFDDIFIFTERLTDGLSQINKNANELSPREKELIFSYLKSKEISNVWMDLAPQVRYMRPDIKSPSSRAFKIRMSELSVVPGTARIEALEPGMESSLKVIERSQTGIVLASPMSGRINYWILFDRSMTLDGEINDPIEVTGTVDYSGEAIIFVRFDNGVISTVGARLSEDKVDIDVGDISQYRS